MPTSAKNETPIKRFNALGRRAKTLTDVRLEILSYLAQVGQAYLREIEEHLEYGRTTSNISRHLNILLKAGLVEQCDDVHIGARVYYRRNEKALRKLYEELYPILSPKNTNGADSSISTPLMRKN